MKRLPLLLVLLFIGLSYAQEPVRVDLEIGADKTVIALSSSEAIKGYELIKLDSPPRLIADIWGATPKETLSIPPEIDFIKKITLGEFKGRTRLILEFAGPEFPAYSASRQENRLLLTLQNPPGAGRIAKAPKPVARSEAPVAVPAPAPEPKKSPQPQDIPEVKLEARELNPASEIVKPSGPALEPQRDISKVITSTTQVAKAETPPRPEASQEVVRPTEKVYTGEKISLVFEEADIRNVLRIIAEVSKLNIIAGEDVKGKISIRMLDVPWDQALETILKLYGLDMERVEDTIRIATAETLRKEREEKIKELEEEQRRRLEKEKRIREEALREQLEARRAERELEELIIRRVTINYTDVDELAKQLEKLKSDRPGAAIVPSAKDKSILIKDIEANVNEMLKLIKEIDIPTPQVLIEARIVQATASFARDIGVELAFRSSTRGGTFSIGGGLGIQAVGADVAEPPAFMLPPIPPAAPAIIGSSIAVGFPAAVGPGVGGALGLTWGRVADIFQLNARLTAAETEGKVQILSSPKVITLDNKEAKIRQGAKIPFQVQTPTGPQTIFKNADLSLTITPRITPERTIFMTVEVTNDRPGPVVATGVGPQPSINTSRAITEILARNGETIVIGGIVITSEREAESGVPGLMKIPILGWLFKRRTVEVNPPGTGELLVFITPTIISPEDGR